MRIGDTAPQPVAANSGTNYPAVAATSRGFVLGWTEQDGERATLRTAVVR